MNDIVKELQQGWIDFHKENQLVNSIQNKEVKDLVLSLRKRLDKQVTNHYNLMHTIREIEYAEKDNDNDRIKFWNDKLHNHIHVVPYGTK